MIASKISRQFSRNLSGSFSKQNSSKILIENSPPQQSNIAIPEEIKDPQQPQQNYNQKRQSSRFPEIINVTPEAPLATEEEKAIIDHNQPSFASAEEYKTEFKYNLIDMLPSTYERSGTPENAKDRKRKTQGGVSTVKKKRQDQQNKVIIDGPISKFIQKYQSLVKRYLVLNQHALFVYKDNLAF